MQQTGPILMDQVKTHLILRFTTVITNQVSTLRDSDESDEAAL